MKDQKIKCTVAACKFNQTKENDCSLPSITVVPDADNPCAHFCKQYTKK